MTVSLHEVHKSEGPTRVLEALAADGAVIVHDFLAPELLERFRADMVAHASGRPGGTTDDLSVFRTFWGERTVRFTRLAHRSRAFVDILTDPFYLQIADAALLASAQDYWMNTGQMMIIGPGERAQFLHRDADNWPGALCRPDGIEVTISCMFAITDFTAEAGATRVVPGSHRWEDYDRRATPDEVCQAVMPAGSGMIYTGRVLHGGGENRTTDEFRYGLHLSYVAGWLTPEEAGPLGTTWDDVRDLSPVAQRLLGWRRSRIDDRWPAPLWTVDYDDVPVGLGLVEPEA